MPGLIVPRLFAAVRRPQELPLAVTTEKREAARSASVWRDPSWRLRLRLQLGLIEQQKGHHPSLCAAGVRVLSRQVSLLQLVSSLPPRL